MDLNQINKQHPALEKYRHRYDFLYRSYIGGELYREGSYLHKYWGEENAPFDAYARRLDATPLDNHVKTTVDIYRSYIWKNPPSREFGVLESNPFVQDFVANCDQNGKSLDAWLKNALDWAVVLGSIWVLVDKPTTPAETSADEIALNRRGYLSFYTPQNVMDWKWDKDEDGKLFLEHVKTIERSGDDEATIRCWYPEAVVDYEVKYDKNIKEYSEIISKTVQPNELGRIPLFPIVPTPLPDMDGLGDSMLGDVADTQKSIYNKLSELEQTIRLSTHPTLVKTDEAEAVAGAGSIINVPADAPEATKPYLLQPTGSSIDGIIEAINHDVDSINSMTHLSAVRTQKSSAQSGIALQTERELLNAKLGDLSDLIRDAELRIWDLWTDWMDVNNTVNVQYSYHFDTRDPKTHMDLIQQAMAAIADPAFTDWAKTELVKLVIKDESEMNQIVAALTKDINNNDDE